MTRALVAVLLVACGGSQHEPVPRNTAPATPALDQQASDAVKREGHCIVELSAPGWSVNRFVVDRNQISALCKLGRDHAVLHEGTQHAADWKLVEQDLAAAGVEYANEQLPDPKTCMDNPLATGCS